jgi:hypothetical protein
MPGEWRLIGLPRPGVRPVSVPLTRVLSRPSTRLLRLVSSFDFRRLFRAPSRSPPPDPFGSSRLPGSLPSSRHHPSESTTAALPRASASFRPQAITASRRFTPHSGSEVCFTLEPCPGMFGVQGVLSPRSAPPSSGGAAPLPLPSGRSAGSRDPPPTSRRLGFEASLHAEQRSHRLGVEPGRQPLPSSRSVSSRFPALRMGPRLTRRPPLTAFRPTPSACADGA